MNWKIFGTFLMVLTLVTSVALGQGTAPTILEGNYISNVFGQSNFIKNPNAKLNTKDVVASSATVAQSKTSPLVATTKFLVTFSAGGTVTWSTRAFDAGMKNQNCESRFSYKGFLATSKAQVFQGANKVAELALSPTGTDPRIASINFPCGDLSQATTFVLTDSAVNSGTNEIGGIYVGLATNQANVAQAEFYGSMINYGTNCIWSGNGSSAIAEDTDCSTYTNRGSNIQPATKVPAITYTPVKSGTYEWSVSIYVAMGSNDNGTCRVFQNGVAVAPLVAAYFSGGLAREIRQSVTSSSDLNAGTSYTFDIRCDSGRSIIARGLAEAMIWDVKRFPTSSELVVTPERQNTFAGLRANSSGTSSNLVTTNAWTKLTSAGALTRTVFGKTKVETNNDYSITIENMPVGTYQLNVSGLFIAISSASGVATECIFGLADTATGGGQIGIMNQFATGDATATAQSSSISGLNGMYTNSSVATRTFYLQAYRVSGAGSCYVYTDSLRPVTISVIPLDQPSNSALYVEGPVKASATGAAIPAGYQFEELTGTIDAGFIMASGSVYKVGQITLSPGIYFISSRVYVSPAGSNSITLFRTAISTSNGSVPSTEFTSGSDTSVGADSAHNDFKFVRVTTSTTYYLNTQVIWTGASNTSFSQANSYLKAYRLN